MATRWLDALPLKLRTLLRGAQVDRELDEELAYHIARKTEQLIAQGLPPDEARYAALRAFGGVERQKEDCRDVRGPWASVWLERLWQDVRHGSRVLVKNPAFTVIAVLSIAIGVGANAGMFSVADGFILRPLPVPDADQLVALSGTTPAGEIDSDTISYLDYVDVRTRARSFEGLTAYRSLSASIARGHQDAAQSRYGLAVSRNFFDLLRVTPVLGRTFVPDEDTVPGRDAVVVLSHESWTQQFGADAAIVGQQIRLGGRDFTVIGITPEAFTGVEMYLSPAFYVPMAMLPALNVQGQPGVLERRDLRNFEVLGRLAPGVSLAQADQEVRLIAESLQHTYPDTNTKFGLVVRSEMDTRFDDYSAIAGLSVMLIGLAVAVLLVACANVALLLTSRGPARAREIALRLAVGGSRMRLMRQLVTESFIIAVVGGLLGIAVGYGVIRSFQQFQIVTDVGVRFTFALDRRVLMVGLALAAVSALLSSLVPAWRSTRVNDLSNTLRGARSTATRTPRLWGRHGLVAVQIALTLVLLTVALSFYRAFEREYGLGPGFKTDHLLLATLDARG